MKKMLLLMTLGCLSPMAIDAICFRYVDGPNGLDSIKIEVDATKVGSNLPTIPLGATLTKGDKYYTLGDIIFTGKTVYVTVKEYTGILSRSPVLIKGKELDSKAAYEITIDDNKKVTFTKIADSCSREDVGSLIKY